MAVRQLLEHPLLYRIWQAPFVGQKIAPVVSSGAVGPAISVLDIGCGPGTNAPTFAGKRYVGLDLSERYVAHAGRRHPEGEFLVRDATEGLEDLGSYDLVLLNSLMHHLDDHAAEELLASLPPSVSPTGEVHILDLILPARPSVSRLLALADRGDHPRSISRWCELVARHLEIQSAIPFSVGLGRLELWSMLHIRASARA